MKTIKFLALFLAVGALAAFKSDTFEGGYKVGDIATDFSLKNTDSKKVALKDYKDAAAVKQKYVENAVDALLKGKEVPVKETKAIGCSIKA